MGLEIAKRALAMSQLNLQVIAHNIANAGTEGYSRQRAELTASPPLAYPCFTRPGFVQQLGTGVDIKAVNRIRDEFLDEIIRLQTGVQGRNTTLQNVLNQIELILNEPGETGLNTALDDFFAAWQDLANDPELTSSRASLREAAISLVKMINNTESSLDRLAIEQITELKNNVTQINSLSRQIADLNIIIAQVKGLGDSPNDLMDQRDQLLEQMSAILPISTIEQENGSISVLVGGIRIIEDDKAETLEVYFNPNDPGNIKIRFKNKSELDIGTNGILGGLLESYNDVIPHFSEMLNTLTGALVNRINYQHRKGFGLDGEKGRPFFEDFMTAEMAGTVKFPSGVTEDTPIDELGITAGDFTIQGQKITITSADVAPGEAITIGELLERINQAQPFVRAILDYDFAGESFIHLELFNPVSADTEISVFRGTSNFLAAMGLEDAKNTFTDVAETYSGAASMLDVSMVILENLDAVAAAGDDGSGMYPGPGNNSNALAIASLQSMYNAVNDTTFGDFYTSLTSELGTMGQTTDRLASNQSVLLDQLSVQRESIRGVNLDEEATAMITYQRIYEGAARVTQVVDSLLDTLINRTGA